MMLGGRTAHSRFRIPIPTLPTSTCKIMAHRHTFGALDRTLQDLFDTDLLFGGKIMILGGDFRQVLFVTRGTRAQTVDACITHSPLWQHVKLLRLTENMRARTDPVYSDMLIHIGDGNQPFVEDDMIRIPNDMVIPWDDEQSLLQLINAIFPSMSENAYDKDYIMQRALITPKNNYVDELNHQVLQLFPGTNNS
ncbi:hypothetical protein AQUCO_14900003v1 [Aquilegia coerulea]|uniref:ATP-dependent DNA helicase n=1 Tax=Aquilegia coerulea TaxID=218851 RepID=A0A2G5C0U8_AQUCA|nr:hypothetical protein AQUCO_14900003v1 [Aquilegia coerulea]